MTEKNTSETEVHLLNRILEHRLQQADIRRLLGALSTRDRDEFLGKLADILSRMNALLDVSNRLADSLSLDVLFQRLVEITTEAVGADRGTIFLIDPRSSELFARVAMGNGAREIRFPNHLGIAGAVFTTGEAIIIPDAYADPRFNQAVDKKTGYRTRNLITAPIRSKAREVVGVLQLLNKQVGDFTEDDLALLEALASQASAALQNAQLFEAVEKAQREEAQLLEVTRAISTELHLIPLLGRIMSMVTKILDADRSTLFLNDDKTSQLWAQVAEGVGTATIRFPNHLGIAGSVFTTGQKINIPDAYADPRFNQAVDKKTGYRTETILCCPVLSKDGRPIGVTQVLNKRGGPFTTLDEERLMAFSAQASIAIENAKLFEEVLNTKNYAEGILQSMSNGVLTLDAEGGIVRCNAAAIRILRRPEAEVVGQAAAAFFAGANVWVLEALGRVNASGRSDVAVDATLHLAGTDTVSVNLTAVPLVSSSGERLGAMLVLEDISKEKRLKGTLARYMTKEVADKLLEEGEAALGGREQEATVLFSDIRSFTTLSEALGAPETVAMLNEYFSLMVDVVFAHGGILDKYIGDAIMAVFGTPYPTGRDADNAVTAAVEMLRALRRFNAAREAAGRPAIRIGIGINTDQVVAGNIGSLRRMDYTVIGDGVNLASRLEGACKAYGSSLIISKATHDRLGECVRCREIDLLRVKGKTEPVAIYEVLAHHDETSWPGLDDALPRFAASLAAYRRAEFAAALEGFTALVAAAPQDRASAVYAERCRIFLQTPPPLDWDGVFTMTSK